MITTDNLTFDTKLGRFTFSRAVPIALAKLLRDSVVGQFFNPQGTFRINSEADAQDYVYEHLNGHDLAHIQFQLDINPDLVWSRPKQSVLV